jgi:ferric-dicitrate binding protein FerR (iron transport regulator)
MTEPTRYANLAARLLRERPAGKDSTLSRDAGVSAIAHAIALGRRRRALRITGLAAGVAAAAAVVLFFALPRGGSATAAMACPGAACSGAARPASAQAAPHGLDRGQSIVAPANAPTSVVLASGTQIALAAKSALECREDGATQRFALTGGSAHLHVAKLRAGERFLVQTPDAEVEVRGTVFDVKIEPETPACSAHTVVTVEEGTVQVRAAGVSTALHAGDSWSGSCGAAAPPSHARNQAKKSPPTEPALGSAHRAAPSLPAPETEAARPLVPEPSGPAVSELGEQNDLFALAEMARKAGRSGEALGAYARLLARFPGGQLAEAAVVQRARLLAKLDPAGARREAERYLARYPAGFARAEMEALAHAP